MTRDEVMAMTDEQLQMKSEEMSGYKRIRGFAPPNYLNDIKAAWTLVEKMQSIPEGGGPRWEIELSSDVGDWCCTVAFEGWIGEVYEVHADSAAKAITRAFIAAKEHDARTT